MCDTDTQLLEYCGQGINHSEVEVFVVIVVGLVLNAEGKDDITS